MSDYQENSLLDESGETVHLH